MASELLPGNSRNRRIAKNEAHVYRLAAAAGQLLEVEVEQDGIDVAVEVEGSQGHDAVTYDTPTGASGREVIPLVSDDSPWSLRIIPSPGGNATGSYHLRVAPARDVSAEGRERARLARAFARAYALTQRKKDIVSYDQIAAAFEPLAEDYQALGDPAGRLAALLQLGRAYRRSNRPELARRHLEEALENAQALDDRASEGIASSLLGTVALDQGDLDSATVHFLRMREVGVELERHTLRMNALHSLAVVEYRHGRPDGALASFLALAGLARKTGRDGPLARALTEIGLLHLFFADYQNARAAFEEALDLLPEGESHDQRGLINTGLGRTYRWTGDLARARQALGEAIKIWAARGRRRFEAMAANDLAGVEHQAGDLRRAENLLRIALARYQELSLELDQATVLSNLGHVLNELSRPREARIHLEQALSVLDAFPGSVSLRANVLFGLAKAAAQEGQIETAIELARRTVELVERLRWLAGSARLKTTLFASKQDRLGFYIDLLAESYLQERDSVTAEELFQAIERAKAQSLVDELRVAGLEPPARFTPADRTAHGTLVRQIEQAEREFGERPLLVSSRRLSSREGGGGPEALQALWDRLEVLQEELRARYPLYATLVAPRVASLNEARALLADDRTLLLVYYLGESRSVLMVIGRESDTVHFLPPRHEIETLAYDSSRSLASSAHPRWWSQAQLELGLLSRAILEPARGAHVAERWIVVPDGALEAIPFQVLPATGEPEGQRSVLEVKEVVSVPSVTAWGLLRDRQLRSTEREPGVDLTIIADPVHRPDDSRLSNIAQRRARSERHAPELPRLEETVLEASFIQRLLPSGAVNRLVGFDASLENLETLGPSGILHFAVHAEHDPDDLVKSGLLLSTYDHRGRPRAGLLSTESLYLRDLPARLVVLAACRSGLGPQVPGEGFSSLARAFLHAGAGATLVSLWDVGDRPTRILMERFYRHFLVGGQSAATALRRAQLEVRATSGFEAPYYWSGFVLQGDWRVYSTPASALQ